MTISHDGTDQTYNIGCGIFNESGDYYHIENYADEYDKDEYKQASIIQNSSTNMLRIFEGSNFAILT